MKDFDTCRKVVKLLEGLRDGKIVCTGFTSNSDDRETICELDEAAFTISGYEVCISSYRGFGEGSCVELGYGVVSAEDLMAHDLVEDSSLFYDAFVGAQEFAEVTDFECDFDTILNNILGE